MLKRIYRVNSKAVDMLRKSTYSSHNDAKNALKPYVIVIKVVSN